LHEGVVSRRFVLGEGIEKKTNDLAKEVEAQTKAFEEAAAKKAVPAQERPAPAQEAASEPAQVLPPSALPISPAGEGWGEERSMYKGGCDRGSHSVRQAFGAGVVAIESVLL
jgi:hypothetical protein